MSNTLRDLPDIPTLQAVPGAIWLGNAQGLCSFANDALARTIGLPSHALLGAGWQEKVPSEDRDELLHRLQHYASLQTPFRTRIRLISSARIRTFRAEGSVLPPGKDNVPGILLSLQDITYTARNSFRRQLRSEQLRVCFEHAPVGMAFLNTSLQIIRSNPFFDPLLSVYSGTAEGLLLPEILPAILAPEIAEQTLAACYKTLETGTAHVLNDWPLGTFEASDRNRFSNWEIRRIETTDNIPVGILLTVSDITSSYETRQELARAHESLERRVRERTTELALANLTIQDRAQQQASVAELGARALAGTPTTRLIQEAASCIVSILRVDYCSIRELTPDHQHLVLKGAAGWPPGVKLDRLRAGTRSQSGFTILKKEPVVVDDMDTETRFEISPSVRGCRCKSSISVALTSDQLSFGAISCFTRHPRKFTREDTNFLQAVANVLATSIQRQRADEGLQLARKQAEAASRTKSEFLSRTSHELRTPLNAIVGFAQLLELDNPSPSQTESITHITAAGKHLLTLINELLDISRIESAKIELSLEPLELTSFLTPCLELMQPLASISNISLNLTPCPKPHWVSADPQKLKQVVINLLSNAIKYNIPNGSVTVSLQPGPTTTRFLVADSGPGIPSEQIPHLFTPFHRLGAENSDVEGTGLGLSLCKGLLTAMNGAIGLESNGGKGCIFWAELPNANPSDLPTIRLESSPNFDGTTDF